MTKRMTLSPRRAAALFLVLALAILLAPASALAQSPQAHAGGGEASLVVPDLCSVRLLGLDGRTLLMIGLVVCGLGLVFGLVIYTQIRALPVHDSMREISELIYETCKTYLVTQGKFLLHPRGVHRRSSSCSTSASCWASTRCKVTTILLFSLVGIGGSYGVAWFGIRINTFANSRTAFASLEGKPFPVYAIPLKAGMSVGMLLISVELFLMLVILLFIPGDYAGPLLHRLRDRRIAGRGRPPHRRRHLHQDRRHRLRPDEDRLQHQGRRRPQPRRDRRLHRGQRRATRSGPSADGFETYGVTGVALISFILLAVTDPIVQVQLLVWIFMMRVLMIVASGGSYLINEAIARARYGDARRMNFETPLTTPGLADVGRLGRPDLPRLLGADPRPWATARSGGSSPRSSPAGRWPARSSPSW